MIPLRRSRAILGMGACLTLTAVVTGPPGAQAADEGPRTPRFVNATKASGVRHTFDGEMFYVGGGVAVFDCDADERPDLYLAGGDQPAGLYRNRSATGGPLRFRRVEDPATDLTSVTGAYPIDIDGDGKIDLAVLRLGNDVLLRGLGDCRFEAANDEWGFDAGDGWSTAFSATWEGTAALPTLAIGRYVDMSGEATAEDMCQDDVLVRPEAAGTRYAPPIPLSPSYCTLSLLFSDWDRTGRRDLRVTNDQHYYRDGTDQLWRIEPGEAPILYGEADGWQDFKINGMGIAAHDVTGDGFPEYYLTNQGENHLQSLSDGPGQPTFENIGYPLGVGASVPFTGGDQLASTAWHPEFADVNNDGHIDLFVSKGNIGGVEGYAEKDPSNLMLGRADGGFVERAKQSGILSFKLGRGAALADLNGDGLLDLVQLHRGSPVTIWRNLGAGKGTKARPLGHWVAIELRQPGPDRDAIGAWIEVRTEDQVQRREVTIGGGHAGGQLGPVHVGLGDSTEAQVRVQWPDGEWSDWVALVPDQVQVLERGASTTSPVVPPR